MLCELCASIKFEELPKFPDDLYRHSITGFPNLQTLHLNPKSPSDDHPSLGCRYHADLESLRRAAAAGCELCRMVETQADAVLKDLAEYEAKDDHKVSRQLIEYKPTFDMWISKRPVYGDGVWVVTFDNGNYWKPETLIPVATLGFCVDDDDPLANIFKGRRPKLPAPDGSPDARTVSRVVDFVTKCDENHPGCAHEVESAQMPTRLLDVSALTGDSHSIRLVELPPGVAAKYATLSYCWGDGLGHFTTTQSTMAARRDHISLNELPKTFKDTVVITRALGVRYLWIDSLCICQDDQTDWERESARMAAVYTNAYLTISATGSASCHDGLIFKSTRGPYIQLPYNIGAGGSHTVLTCPLDMRKEIVCSDYVLMPKEPLQTRGWAFQERALARRVLHFASDQIYFECLEGIVAEDGLHMDWRYHTVHSTKFAEFDHRSTLSKTPAEHQRWTSLVRTYSSRKLTYASDKLPALSGIASHYGQALDDQYVAGLWRKHLLEGLAWQALHCTPPPGGRYRAPSWSWASVEGTAAGGFRHKWEEVATVLDCRVELKGENAFGEVTSGRIELEAPLISLSLSDTPKGPGEHMGLCTEHGDTKGNYASFDTIHRAYDESAELVKAMELYAAVLTRHFREKDESEQHYFSLILTPSGESDGSMRRVGYIIQEDKDFGPGGVAAAMKNVVII